MNRELIIPEKNSIFTRIKKYFSNVFNSKKSNEENDNKNEIVEVNEINNNSFEKEIKNSLSENNDFNILDKDEFIEELVKNKQALESLTFDRLKKIENYYEDRVNKKREYLKKLQNNS